MTLRPDRDDDRRFLSPVVRRLVAEHGLDPAAIRGSGLGGRLTRTDVLAAAAATKPRSAVGTPAAPIGTPAGIATPAPAPGDEVVPFSPIRRRIAEHLMRSQTTAAHAFCSVRVDFERLERVRREHGAQWREREGFGLTYLPFIVRAVVDALAEFPTLNATTVGEEIWIHDKVDLGVAVDLGFEGLVVPIIRDVETKRLRAIARSVVEVAGRARAGGLSVDDMSGGTFTITNPGAAGTQCSIPIINQPQVAILVTDGVARRPVVVTDGGGRDQMVFHAVGTLGLSFDHRAVTGYDAARFLAQVRTALQERDWDTEL